MTPAFVACALFAVAVSTLVTALGVARCLVGWRREMPRHAGGPYRSVALVAEPAACGAGERLVALGSGLLTCATAPALVVALATLRWEGIGVSLLPALALSGARLFAAFKVMGAHGLGPLRTVGTASLLLDVPLAGFAYLHVRLTEGYPHDALSLATVAMAFAATDGLHATLLLWTKPNR